MPTNSLLPFLPITLVDKEKFSRAVSEDINFENTFATMFLWSKETPYEIAEFENSIVGRWFYQGKIVYDIPKTVNDIERCVASCFENSKKEGGGFRMNLLKKHWDLLSYDFKQKFAAMPTPERFDYVYSAKDLSTYGGAKFAKKRNHLSRFKREYEFQFLDYNENLHKEKILALLKKWQRGDSERDDSLPLICALNHLQELDLFCDVLLIHNEICAFSISLFSHKNCGEFLFEKADTLYRGSYAAITNFTAEKHFANVEFINRQEDLGLENLREAKLQLQPIFQIEKVRITL